MNLHDRLVVWIEGLAALASLTCLILWTVLRCVLPFPIAVLCMIGCFHARKPFWIGYYASFSVIFTGMSIKISRTLMKIWKSERAPRESPPTESVAIPMQEIPAVYTCAHKLRPASWWTRDLLLTRAPAPFLNLPKRSRPPLQITAGLAVLSGLTTKQLEALLTYATARHSVFPSRLDLYLERIHDGAVYRLNELNRKPGQRFMPRFWVPLRRITAKIKKRNVEWANQWTISRCGKDMLAAALARKKQIDQAWPVFENNVLVGLIRMGGLPPVAQGFRRWLNGESLLGQALRTPVPNAVPSESASDSILELRSYEEQLYRIATKGADLLRIQWDRGMARLGPTYWERQSQAIRAGLKGKQLQDLSGLLERWFDLRQFLPVKSEAETEAKQQVVNELYFATLYALSRVGWVWRVGPLEPTVLERDGRQIVPQLWFRDLLTGQVGENAFTRILADCGLSAVPLSQDEVIPAFVM